LTVVGDEVFELAATAVGEMTVVGGVAFELGETSTPVETSSFRKIALFVTPPLR